MDTALINESNHPLLAGKKSNGFEQYWIMPEYSYADGKMVLASCRMFECLKNDGAWITVQERTVDNFGGTLQPGADVIGKPFRKKLYCYSDQSAYFLPTRRRIDEARQWTKNKFPTVGEEW